MIHTPYIPNMTQTEIDRTLLKENEMHPCYRAWNKLPNRTEVSYNDMRIGWDAALAEARGGDSTICPSFLDRPCGAKNITKGVHGLPCGGCKYNPITRA